MFPRWIYSFINPKKGKEFFHLCPDYIYYLYTERCHFVLTNTTSMLLIPHLSLNENMKNQNYNSIINTVQIIS
jgi:hypothetical protein